MARLGAYVVVSCISLRNRDGFFVHPRYCFAVLSVSCSFVLVMATKQLRRSSSIAGLSLPFLMLWNEGMLSSAMPMT